MNPAYLRCNMNGWVIKNLTYEAVWFVSFVKLRCCSAWYTKYISVTTLLVTASAVKMFIIFELYKSGLWLIFSNEWSQTSYYVSETYVSSICCL